MEHIIEALYINLSRPQPLDGPKLEEIKEEYSKMRDLVVAQYGPDLLDRFVALRSQIDERNWEKEFSLGFRTGVRLMPEVVGA